MSGAPILSVCVPTFDRADLLELLLSSLGPQVADMDGVVELLVSDNCSTDRTPDVVRAAAERWPVTSFRNDANVGSSNMLLAAQRASGAYSWIVGDDDLVLPGVLEHVVDVLRAHPEVEYLFANFFQAPVAVRDAAIRTRELDASWTRPEACVVRERDDRVVERWEDLLSLDAVCPSELFTSILCSVMRVDHWREYAHLVRPAGRPRVSAADSRLDDLFPHIKVIAHAMVGRPACYVARPCALMGQGGQEWLSDWPAISIVGIAQALRLYEELGVSDEVMERLWRSYFRQTSRFLPVIGPERSRPCLQSLSWPSFLLHNLDHADVLAGEVWRRVDGSMRGTLRRTLPGGVYHAGRAVWRLSGSRRS